PCAASDTARRDLRYGLLRRIPDPGSARLTLRSGRDRTRTLSNDVGWRPRGCLDTFRRHAVRIRIRIGDADRPVFARLSFGAPGAVVRIWNALVRHHARTRGSRTGNRVWRRNGDRSPDRPAFATGGSLRGLPVSPRFRRRGFAPDAVVHLRHPDGAESLSGDT